MNILIIDDHYEEMIEIQARLEREVGLESNYFLAKNERDTEYYLNRKDIDLAIIDIDLGKENGYDVSKKFNHNNIPVLLIAGALSFVDHAYARSCGATEVCAKTTDFKCIIDCVVNFFKHGHSVSL